MAQPTTTKGGRFRVLLGDDATPTVYTSKCGFSSKSLTFTKGLDDIALDDCDDPDKIPWLARDATSLGMTISGEGVLAEESVEDWIDAWEDPDSVPVKVEIEFPTKTITWTGKMQVGTMTVGHPTSQGRVTNQVEMSSDGEMVRVVTPAA